MAKNTVEERWRDIESSLSSLDSVKLKAIATFSTERAVRYYSSYCNVRRCSDPTICSEMVAEAWRAIEVGGEFTDAQRKAARLDASTKQLEDADVSLAIAAQEACFACTVLLNVFVAKSDPMEVARILRFVRDIVDMLVQEQDDFALNNDLESSVLSHPLMKREIEVHQVAIELLRSRPFDGSLIERIRGIAHES